MNGHTRQRGGGALTLTMNMDKFQLLCSNLRRAHAPVAEFAKLMQDRGNPVSAIQEPTHSADGEISGLPGLNIITGGIKARAAILALNSVNIIPCSYLSSRDLAVAIYDKMLLCSIYMDIEGNVNEYCQ